MKRILTRLGSMLLVLFMLLTLLPTAAFAAGHQHCVCGESAENCTHGFSEGDEIQWQPLDNITAFTDEKIPEGNYYLTQDINMRETGVWLWTIEGDVKLCLNGHSLGIDGNDNTTGRFLLAEGASLAICDCSPDQSGRFLSTAWTYSFNGYEGGAIELEKDASLYVYGCKFDVEDVPSAILARGENSAVYLDWVNIEHTHFSKLSEAELAYKMSTIYIKDPTATVTVKDSVIHH